MRECLKCSFHWEAKEVSEACPKCQHKHEYSDGFIAFAPELAHENDGFNVDAFEYYAKYEDENFWFKARNSLLLYLLNKYCSHMKSFLEIGCGTGYVLREVYSLAKQLNPEIKVYGSEIYTKGLSHTHKRTEKAILMQLNAKQLPFYEEFDVIGSFDVLEHIDDDFLVLQEMHKALKKNGYIILSVPQHMAMWSKADEDLCHVRRYSSTELQEKVESVGFQIKETTSFMSFLSPLMYLSRLRKNVSAEMELPKWVNIFFYGIASFEVWCIKKGLRLPFGGSRIVIAQKN